MVLGKVFATAAMDMGYQVTWLPSYGAEVRGGTAHSMVRISTGPIASPIVSSPTSGVIMNTPSLDKFEKAFVQGALLILNSSMTDRKVKRKDLDLVEAPLTDEAIKIGNVRVANIIAAGIYIAKKNIISTDAVTSIIEKMAEGREHLIPVNIKALERGIEIGGSR